MTISIHQIHPVFVAEVSGADISKPLSADEVTAVDEGMNRYAVLVFHEQRITDEQHWATCSGTRTAKPPRSASAFALAKALELSVLTGGAP